MTEKPNTFQKGHDTDKINYDTHLKNWQSFVQQAHDLDQDTFQSKLNEGLSPLSTLSSNEINVWLEAAVEACNFFDEDDTFVSSFFQGIILTLFKFLSEDTFKFLNNIALFGNCVLNSKHALLFIPNYSENILQFIQTIGPTFDLNILLALQSCFFASITKRYKSSHASWEMWFKPIVDNCGNTIFGDDLPKAIAYFKIMNHAFFQCAITSNSLVQDPTLVEIYSSMKSASVSLSKILLSQNDN